ncbi:protein-L-isoaspartate(D-aspartate) O-methyltransferase [Agromyces seonyuensis]|uniref:Protein-L-isoaspartate O-methyltransferase n=1 Tax=Agromyces seonyuensis TaxID=2662446 RepID=A0A6I4P0L7_9MICO|nr:protein-L-isoaspartate(D-aspartate) O-methyltransferase [Agromyces seonyuensis]MWC00141.1 protein-L-isoaspartate(D-aspartate) O-methyltransferase [Agromyces seonyuensis]
MDAGGLQAGERAAEREEMLDWHLRARGIGDPAVLAAMLAVPRELFVPIRLADEAYADHPLPIGHGQTISQPYIVALMAEAAHLSPGERVLDVGTGSGYAAAVYGRIAGRIVSIERVPELASEASGHLADIDAPVEVLVGDGTLGAPQAAPFDAVLAAAAGPEIPRPWLEQLADGGRIVMPIESDGLFQELVRVTRHGAETVTERLGAVRFVPLIGAFGHPGGALA